MYLHSIIILDQDAMKKNLLVLILCTVVLPIITTAQDTLYTFTNMEEALQRPQEVLRLDLSGQDINFSLEALRQFKNIEYLSLRNDHLKEIPEEVFDLEQLKVLDLSGNDFVILPREIKKLKNLEELYLNEEERLDLKQSIDALIGLPNLRTLHLEGDQIAVFPENIFELENLEYLYLKDNELVEIPQGINRMNRLKLVDLQSNPIPPPIQNSFNREGNVLIRF